MSARAANLLAWFSVGVSVALALPALMLASRTYPSVSGFLSSPSVLNAMLALAFPSVGALIVSRRPRNRVGWLLWVEGVANAVAGLAAGDTPSRPPPARCPRACGWPGLEAGAECHRWAFRLAAVAVS